MDKLALLNKIPVVDYEFFHGYVGYIAVENNEENRQTLRELGATEEDLIDMAGGNIKNDTLDIAGFGFNICGAKHWSSTEGFVIN